MAFSYTIRLGLLALAMNIMAIGQTATPSQQSSDTSAQESSETAPQENQETPSEQRTAPSPAFGQTAPILSPENPPVSGIDEPKLDLVHAQRSFISGGVVAAESADTNPNNQLGNTSGVKSVSHLLGALDLQRFWAKSDLLAEYLGGGSFYTSGVNDVRQIQAVGLLGVTRWRTGQIAVHDTFSYLPEGSFGGGGGGKPGLGLAEAGGLGIPGGNLPGSHSFGGSQFGSVGLVGRLTSLTIVDVQQSLTPRSAITLAGGYSMAHYLEDQDTLFNAQQVTVEGGYSHLLNRRDQLGVIYGFREFHFPQSEAGKIDSHVLFLRWRRTITGRMSLLLGVGPQYTSVYQPGIPFLAPSAETTSWTAAGRAALHYQFTRTSLTASYEKFTSSGSGFFAGADTQVARVTFAQPIARRLDLSADLGFSHSTRLSGFGTGGRHYNTGFAGAMLHKRMGHNWGVFARYRFDVMSFDDSVCLNNSCGRIVKRQSATIGVDWQFRPVRIE